MQISLIAAVSQNNVIGHNEKIPWEIPGEQKRFRELTSGKTIIMGRKTFESIGKPLPNRKTIIITRNENYIQENCIIAHSLEEALDLAKKEKEVFIAGGGEIYQQAMPLANKIYLTIIEKEFIGNIYFPKIDKKKFQETFSQKIPGKIPYIYKVFEAKHRTQN